MKEFFNLFLKSLGNTSGAFLNKLVGTINTIFLYLNKYIDRKNKKDKIKEEKNITEKIEKVCDKGSLEDLFDLNKFIKSSVIVLILLFSGCTTTIEIQSTKSWEGHYMDEKSFYESTKNIKLDKNESIWVLSNNSLKRILIEKAGK